MVNINAINKKAIGVVKTALNKLNSLNLKLYYFECSTIFLNVLVRSIPLYASELYYQLKENEVRQLERIEEQFMRRLKNAGRNLGV